MWHPDPTLRRQTHPQYTAPHLSLEAIAEQELTPRRDSIPLPAENYSHFSYPHTDIFSHHSNRNAFLSNQEFFPNSPYASSHYLHPTDYGTHGSSYIPSSPPQSSTSYGNPASHSPTLPISMDWENTTASSFTHPSDTRPAKRRKKEPSLSPEALNQFAEKVRDHIKEHSDLKPIFMSSTFEFFPGTINKDLKKFLTQNSTLTEKYYNEKNIRGAFLKRYVANL